MQYRWPPRNLLRSSSRSSRLRLVATCLVVGVLVILAYGTDLSAGQPGGVLAKGVGSNPGAVPGSGQHFTDVLPGYPFYDQINWCADQHIISGYANGDGSYSFRPGSGATRAQVAKMIVLAEGWPVDTSGGPHFIDVPPTHALFAVVETAYHRGVVSGYACGALGEPCPGSYFHPNSQVTRGQFAKMLVVARGWRVDTSTPPAFVDVLPDSSLFGVVQTAYLHGAISGYACGGPGEPCPGTYYRPGNAITRGQLAKLIYIAYGPYPPPPAPTPTPVAIYWGAYINGGTYDPTWGDAPWDARTLGSFEAHAGKAVSIIQFGQAWESNGGNLQAFDPIPFDLTRSHGAIPLINWNPWQSCCGADQPAWRLANLINGQYDTYIGQWAAAARAWGHPFFLRMMDEMNGNWYPWSEAANGNQPGQYVQAWRHIHDLFAAAGASNVTWVWNPSTEYAGSLPLPSLYPGDSYVDWTGITGYNFGPTPRGDLWTPFGLLFGPTYADLGLVAPNKRVMIGETASTENGGSKAAWITDALVTQLPTAFPRVKAFVWFNWDDGVDWVIESSPGAEAAFAAGIASPYYATNRFGGLNQPP